MQLAIVRAACCVVVLLGALAAAGLATADRAAAITSCEAAQLNPLYMPACESERLAEQKAREAQERLEAREREEFAKATAEQAEADRRADEEFAAEEAAAAKKRQRERIANEALHRQERQEAAIARREATRHRHEWAHKPTVTEAIAKEMAARLMRRSGLAVWRIDCDRPGRVNRTTWSCKASIFYRCLRGRIRVTGAGIRDGQPYYIAQGGRARQCRVGGR